jgi:hypothetical protein
MTTKIKVDPEFRSLLAPLSPEEYNQLQENIKADGCREPLTVWRGESILVDGHNRLEICTELGIKYQTRDMDFPDREAAFNWIIANQLGRRNLKPDQIAYLRGKRYRGEKQQGKRSDLTSSQNGTKSNPQRTAERLADEYGVGVNTIKRDGDFSEAVDTIAATLGDDTKKAILTGEIKQPRAVIAEAAEVSRTEPEKAREMLEAPKEKPDRKPTKTTDAPARSLERIKDDSRLRAKLNSFNFPNGSWALAVAIYEGYGRSYAVKLRDSLSTLTSRKKEGEPDAD